jgi:repressor LexA
MRRLTERQNAVFQAILSYYRENGISPTVREIGAAVGLPNPSAVANHLNSIERAGYIKRLPCAARGIILCDQPSQN